MSMVEPNNYWDGIVDGVNSEDFANILNILDFPMESLEGDGVAGDLDPSSFQNMGPIPLDALTGVPLFPQGHVADAPEIKGSSRTAPINMNSERTELRNYAGYNNGAITPHESFISPKFRTFGTPSLDSILESGGSCSSGKLLTTKPEILESGASCSSGKRLTTKPETVIPRRARSKRQRPSNLHPWFNISPIGSVANRSLHSGNNKNFNKKRLSDSSNISVGLENSSRLARKKLPEGFYVVEKKETFVKQSASSKKCAHCQVTKTPQWREGPLGPRTLCNACGVRYRSGRLLPEYRPASSPTFLPSVHSNSHKRLSESSNISVGLENSSRLARKKLPERFYVVEKKETFVKQSASSKKCAHCQVTKTPQWREGPLGPKTLCNACGVRYRSGRLLPEYRPASSPTFLPSIHSNSHKKVIEMRKKATQQDIESEMPPKSPSPEFVPVSNNLFDPFY